MSTTTKKYKHAARKPRRLHRDTQMRSRRPSDWEVMPMLDATPTPAAVGSYEATFRLILSGHLDEVEPGATGTALAYSRACRDSHDVAGMSPDHAEAARLRVLDEVGAERARGAAERPEPYRPEEPDDLDVRLPRARARDGERVRRGGRR